MTLTGSPAVAADNPLEACFRRLTNRERIARGMKPLVDNPTIDRIAQRHSREMADDFTIYHNDDLEGDYNREAEGYEFGGENVGMGPSCRAVHRAFMASPGHRENVLDPDYSDLGVGVVNRKNDAMYVTLDFFTPKIRVPAKPPSCEGGS